MRRTGRRLSVLTVCVMLLGTTGGVEPAGPRPADAQTTPAVSLSPACGSGAFASQTMVRGTNFRPNTPVSVYFDGKRYDAQADSSGTFTHTLPVPPRKAGAYPVRALQSQLDGGILAEASANYTVPCPPPRITLTPVCGNGASATRTRVDGVNFYPNYPVAVIFDDQRRSAGATDAAGSFTYNLPISSRKAGAFEVDARQTEPDGGVVAQAKAAYTVPCPPAVLTVEPVCGDGTTPTRIRLTGSRFQPALRVTIVFDGRGSRGPAADAAGGFTHDLAVPTRPAGVYPVAARQLQADGAVVSEASATYQVPCPTVATDGKGPEKRPEPGPTQRPGDGGGGPVSVGTIVCVPPLGPPGFVTTVEGKGFPPGATMTLRWALGLGPPVRVTADGSGAFRVAMLVLPREAPGLRLVVADSGTPPPTAPFLVVPGVIQPSGNPALPRFTR